jgi:hypothetical protein
VESLASFADGIWLAQQDLVYLRLRLTATMTVIRLPDGSLLVHSPVALTPARQGRVDQLGPVRHLYAPNLFHHRWIGDWATAYPGARLHAPAGLGRKHRGLRIDRTLGESPEPAFAGVIDEVTVDGFRLREGVLLHRPSRTLVVADLVHNLGCPTHRWTATYARLMGFYNRVALSRAIRWTGFDDRRAARRVIDHLLSFDFDPLVVGHGDPIAAGGKRALAAAYTWLRG